MALVAYDNSDSSEYEDDIIDDTATIIKGVVRNPVIETSNGINKDDSNDNEKSINKDNSDDNEKGIFKLLPKPNKTKQTFEEDDEFLQKKVSIVKPKAQISVPSLSDFKDVDMPSRRPKTASGKPSGLLSMLPEPKYQVSISSKFFIPDSVSKTKAKKKPPLPVINSNSKPNDESEESDSEETTDFFSINKTEELPIIESTPVTECSPAPSANVQTYLKSDVEVEEELEESAVDNDADNSNNGTEDMQIDEEAIRQLCGARGRRKNEEIQIVDFNQQEVLADAREMMRRGLLQDTSTRISASKRKGNEPTSQQKRKHQITYLAHQAKANEAELQNQWANNRMNRRKTQSKYGF